MRAGGRCIYPVLGWALTHWMGFSMQPPSSHHHHLSHYHQCHRHHHTRDSLILPILSIILSRVPHDNDFFEVGPSFSFIKRNMNQTWVFFASCSFSVAVSFSALFITALPWDCVRSGEGGTVEVRGIQMGEFSTSSISFFPKIYLFETTFTPVQDKLPLI